MVGIAGALISRFHGGGFFHAPKWVRGALWALPFGIVAGLKSPLFGIIAFALCFSGKATGHGRGISLLDPLKGEPEKLEVLTLWSQPYLTTYQYKCLILAVSGLLSVSGGIFINPIILLGGLLKPLAYMIGWKFKPSHGTVIGEFLTGFFAYIFLII